MYSHRVKYNSYLIFLFLSIIVHRPILLILIQFFLANLYLSNTRTSFGRLNINSTHELLKGLILKLNTNSLSFFKFTSLSFVRRKRDFVHTIQLEMYPIFTIQNEHFTSKSIKSDDFSFHRKPSKK
jgi:hypothetical protein